MTPYRILERASSDGRWAVFGVAFRKRDRVHLWMPPWRRPCVLDAAGLADLSERHYPSPTERWRWSRLLEWPHRPFLPLQVMQHAASGVVRDRAPVDIEVVRTRLEKSAAVNCDAAYCRGSLSPFHEEERQARAENSPPRPDGRNHRGAGGGCRSARATAAAAGGLVFEPQAPRHNLPYPEVFVGRSKELQQISAWIREHQYRVIALTGIGGIGKSALAIQAAQQALGRFRRVIYLSAKDSIGRRRALTIGDVYRKVEAVAGLGCILCRGQWTPEARGQKAAEVLNAQPSLLVLDNLEVLTAEESEQLASFLRLLDPSQGTMALLTSRREHCPPLVDPMLGNLYHLPVGKLDPADAVVLLSRLLQLPGGKFPSPEPGAVWEKVPSYPVVERERPLLEELARRARVPLDRVTALKELARMAHYHPFLLHIALANLRRKQRSWPEMLQRLKALRGKSFQDKVNDWIGKMCDDLSFARGAVQPLTLLHAMLAFSGGATEEALRAIWYGSRAGAVSREELALTDAIEEAQDASLLDFDRKRQSYDLHPLVRQYLASYQQAGGEQRQQWAEAHANYFLQYAQRHEKDHDALARERCNLFAAMDWAEEGRADRMLVRFARSLFDFLWLRGFWHEGRERLLQGIAAACRLQDRPAEAFLRHTLGILFREMSDYKRAWHYQQETLTLAEHLKDNDLKAGTFHELGILCRFEGQYREADRYYRDALALAEGNNTWLEAMTRHELGVLCSLQGDYKGARRHLEESLVLKKHLNDKVGQGRTLHHLGVVCLAQGTPDEARRYYEEALALEENLGDKGGKARTLHSQGDVCSEQGDFIEARRYYDESLALMEELGDVGSPGTELEFAL